MSPRPPFFDVVVSDTNALQVPFRPRPVAVQSSSLDNRFQVVGVSDVEDVRHGRSPTGNEPLHAGF
jgi:hypothetical protein